MMTNLNDDEDVKIPQNMTIKSLQPTPRQSVKSGESIQFLPRATIGEQSSKSFSKGDHSNDTISEGAICCNFNQIKKICFI